MSKQRFDFSLGACKIYDKQEERLLEDTEVCGLLNELFEHNLHLQRLIESLAKVTGEPIEDTIERYNIMVRVGLF